MNRRNVIKSISLTAVSTMFSPTWLHAERSLSAQSRRSKTAFDGVEEIANGVFFIKGNTTFFENGNVKEVQCNNGWILFDDFVLLIDANLPGNGPYLLAEIRKTTLKPIRYVLNTHHHGDHLYGNAFWAQQGASIIAYSGLIEELKKYETGYYGKVPGRWDNMAQAIGDLKTFPLLPPQITFDTKLVINDKSRHVELMHLGIGHTFGDAVAWLPQEKIMFVGDACLNGPYNLFRDAHIQSWINTLEIMKRYKPDIIVPGHGEAGNEATIIRQQAYFKQVLQWVKKEKDHGNSWTLAQTKLHLLREDIEKDPLANQYLIPEPSVVEGFSLKAHAKKIFEETDAKQLNE